MRRPAAQRRIRKFESNQSGIETNCSKISLLWRFGLNRTRVELKLSTYLVGTKVVFSLNRTRVELKLDVADYCLLWWPGLNRTRVELKRAGLRAAFDHQLGLNRTRVELKRRWGKIRNRWGGVFESNQSGIETNH